MEPTSKNTVKEKSFLFTLSIVKIYESLQEERKEYVLSRQLLRSGSAIGALCREAEHAESRSDFIHKHAIALKEANETKYWLDVLFHAGYISEESYPGIEPKCTELIKMLAAIIKTSKQNR